MFDVYKISDKAHQNFARIVMQTGRWVYLSKCWPVKMKNGAIGSFNFIRQHQDGDCSTVHFRLPADKWKPNLMIKTEFGFIPERKYSR